MCSLTVKQTDKYFIELMLFDEESSPKIRHLSYIANENARLYIYAFCSQTEISSYIVASLLKIMALNLKKVLNDKS